MRSVRISPGRGSRAFEIVDQRDAVDLRRLRRHARLPQQIGLLRQPFHQHRNFRADQRPVARARNLALDRHQPALAILDGAAVHLAVERKAARWCLRPNR